MLPLATNLLLDILLFCTLKTVFKKIQATPNLHFRQESNSDNFESQIIIKIGLSFNQSICFHNANITEISQNWYF